MRYEYYCLVTLPISDRRWTRVSGMVEMDEPITVRNLKHQREYIENHFRVEHGGDDNASLESYELIGFRLDLDSFTDAEDVCSLIHALGHRVEQNDTTVYVTLIRP